MLSDRLVCGINDARIQFCLLSEGQLGYDTAFMLTQVLESADQNTKDLSEIRKQHQLANTHLLKATKCHNCRPGAG